METDKQDLDLDESFFELDECDTLFSSWANLMGMSSDENEAEEAQEERRASAQQTNEYRPGPKETCSLM